MLAPMTSYGIDSFRSDRVFQLWSYGVSMQPLLLRSTKSESAVTTVDVLIRGVNWLQLPTQLSGLDIQRSDSWAETSLPDMSTISLANRALWRVRHADGEGLVVGGNMFAIETTINWDDPSPLLDDYSINLS
jgi:hypothetical protein